MQKLKTEMNRRAFEDHAPRPSLPTHRVEPDEGRVDPDVGAAFVDAVRVGGGDAGDERNPRRKFPLHLDVEIGRLSEFL